MLSKLPFLKVKNVTRNFFEEKYPLGCPDFPLTVCQGIHYRLKLYQNAVDWIGCYMSETIPPPGSQIMERTHYAEHLSIDLITRNREER
jgi:hypothetical protein